MRSSLSLALLAASSLVEGATPSCVKGLYMVVARGSLEPAGAGISANLTDKIAEEIPDSAVAAVDYPATILDYTTSEEKGVKAMHALLEEYRGTCPGGKMAIFGYSQGAHVGMDTICNGIGKPYSGDPAVSSSVLDNVVSMAFYGDPTHIANLTYDRGTSKKNGIFRRHHLAPCLALKSKLISYCDTGDVYCDSGNNTAVHHEYIDKYGDEIVAFVVGQYKKATAAGASSTRVPTAVAARPTSSVVDQPSGAGAFPTVNGLLALTLLTIFL